MIELDRCRPAREPDLTPPLLHIQTPANVTAWEKVLANHPDQQCATIIVQVLTQGFRIGFQYGTSSLRQAISNMPIADPQVVTDYTRLEMKEGRLLEMSSGEASSLDIHCSPIGIIPKKNKPGKRRLIVDLSSLTDASVNNGIDKELCSLSYTSIDNIANEIIAREVGTLTAKMDIKQAYRMVPVHPADRRLLGMKWEGKIYVDKTLPFGLRSAPRIFSSLADALMWIMKQRGMSHGH